MKKLLPFILAIFTLPASLSTGKAKEFTTPFVKELAPKDGTIVARRAIGKNSVIKTPLKKMNTNVYAQNNTAVLNPFNIY